MALKNAILFLMYSSLLTDIIFQQIIMNDSPTKTIITFCVNVISAIKFLMPGFLVFRETLVNSKSSASK